MSASQTPSNATVLHATTIAVQGRAALIRGRSGSGKSGLALQLIAQGAQLVADDRTCIWRQEDQLMADVPASVSGKIEARGVGLLNAPAAGQHPVALIVDLDLAETERLPPMRETVLLDVSLPLVGKSDFAHFPAAIQLYLMHGRLA